MTSQQDNERAFSLLWSGLFLVAAGAIARYAITAQTSALDIQALGLIVIVVGLLAIAIGVLIFLLASGLPQRKANADEPDRGCHELGARTLHPHPSCPSMRGPPGAWLGRRNV